MTNHELNRILQLIQKNENLKINAVAKKAKINRSYLSKFINLVEKKPVGKNLMAKLKTGFPAYFDKNNKSNTENLPVEGLNITMADYIYEIKDHNKFLQDLLKDKISKIGANLETVVGTTDQISLHVESAREVALESLARLEKKTKGTLIDEADRIVARLMKERKKQGSRLDNGM